MKVVFDTNVLISAFVFKGFSAKVMDYCIEHSEIFISQWIIDELEDKLATKFDIPAIDRKRILELLRLEFNLVKPKGRQPSICRDFDDNNVLWLSENAKAEYLISGDKDLLILKSFKLTEIISPRSFWEMHKNKF